MKLFIRFAIFFIASLIGIYISSKLVNGFTIENTAEALITVATLLAIINSFFKPIIKLIMTPVIIMTLGLFNLVINAGLLYILDILSDSLTINGLVSLIYATIIITIANLGVNLFARK
jgi:putative membrane protein